MRHSLVIICVAAVASCGNDGRKPVANVEPVAQADAAPSAVATKPAEPDAGVAEPVDDRVDPERFKEVVDAIGGQDFVGPSMSVPEAWQTCTAKTECDAVYSGCGTQYVVVNKKSVATAEAAWKKTCAASGAKPVSMLAAAPTFACEARACVETLSGGLGGLSDPGLGGRPAGGGVGKRARARAPRVSMSRVTVRGSLPDTIIHRTVRSRFGPLRACYRAALKADDKARGKLRVTFVVTAAGRADKVTVKGSLARPARDCVRRTVRRLRFPAPPKRDNVDARFELRFEPPPKS